jgi:hypothetical protein
MTSSQSAPSTLDHSAAGSHAGSIGTQTAALFIDAYRDLQSRKLFWLTLILSLLVAVSFAFVGINERGITIFTKEYPGVWNTSIIPRASFYKFLFTGMAIPYWLGFLAAILGLIAVGGIFPDMISGGSIDLYLSRPVGRLRLFLTKYVFALLFMALQVLLFSTASFIIIGVRGGSWEPKIFLAVPLVTIFFSYLYCVCVLVGIVTRSTLAAILLTLLFWAGLWSLHTADMAVTVFTSAADERVEQHRRLVTYNDELIERNAALPPDKRSDMSQFEFQRDGQRAKLAEFEAAAADLRWWQQLLVSIKTPLPKTAETVDLMSRWLIDPDPFMQAEEEREQQRADRRARRGAPPRSNEPADNLMRYTDEPEVAQRLQDEINARRFGWIVGTSLGFEIVVLGLAAWVFCRRDY